MKNINLKEIKFEQEGSVFPITIKYDDDEADYVIRFPKKITRTELVDLVEEIKQMTRFDE